MLTLTLIRPPVYCTNMMGAHLVPFLGVAYIGAAARKAGHSVDIIDMCGEDITHAEVVKGKYIAYGMPFSRLKERLKQSDVIGFTCSFSQDWVFHRELIQYVHSLSPKSTLVAGGEHITALPEYCLEDCHELDVCIVGEGEETIVRLLKALEKKGDLSKVKGIAYRRNGNFHQTPRAKRIKDIDKIPAPAWDLIPMENYLSRSLSYHIARGRTIPMLATRGCPYRCSFCSNTNMWGVPWIARNPKRVVDEMEFYVHHYGAENFLFSDLTVVVRKEFIVDLCNEILKRKIKVTLQFPMLRTESVDGDVLKLMYRAGCRDVDFAIESGSDEVLNSVNKKNDPKKISSLVRSGLDLGMNHCVNIILGLPKEGLEDFWKSYVLVMKLALAGLQEVIVCPFVPYPGSKLFEEFLKAQKITLNDDYFFSLFGYMDLSRNLSWSEKFSPRMLNFLRLFLISSFYTLMFVSHPTRISQLFINASRGTTSTKLEGVVKRIYRSMNVYRSERKKTHVR